MVEAELAGRLLPPTGSIRMVFGGAVAVITEGSSASILRADLPVAGKAMFSHQD